MRRNAREPERRPRLRAKLLCALIAGGMPAACATSHVSVEVAEPATAREVPSPAADPGASEDTAADIESADAPEGEMEFTLKLRIDAPVAATSGRRHRIRAYCRRSRVREGDFGSSVGLGTSRHKPPPWELDWKMSSAPGRYIVSAEVDGALSGEAEFELLPSGSAYPQVLEVRVEPPEW